MLDTPEKGRECIGNAQIGREGMDLPGQLSELLLLA